MPTTPPHPWGHGLVMSGRVRTLAVGPVRPLGVGDDALTTAVVKTPVTGRLRLSRDGLEGDEHADPAHGGPDRAVCVYPWEHYSYWADVLGGQLGDAAFGENVTTVGLLETEVHVGDVFAWNDARVQVSGPRPGCATLAARHGVRDLATDVESTGRTGFYLRVLHPGTVSADDPLVLDDVDPAGLSVAAVGTAMRSGCEAAGLTVERVLLARHALPAAWVAALERGRPDSPAAQSA